MEDLSPSYGLDRGVASKNVTIMSKHRSRLVKPDLRKTAFLGLQLIPIQEDHGGYDLRSACVEAHFGSVLQFSRGAAKEVQGDVHKVSRSERIFCSEHIPPLNLLLFNTLEVDGGSKAGRHFINFPVVHLNPADTR